jgi:hypothetical protein
MSNRIRLLVILASILGCTVVASAQEWHGIRVLRSSRKDVERILSMPTERGLSTFDVGTDRVNISFSGAPCAKGWPYGWNVPEGTVVKIMVYPQKSVRVADLRVELSEFEKFAPSENAVVVYYNNEAQGISIGVTADGESVRSIEYFPATKDLHLRCPEFAQREAVVASGAKIEQFPVSVINDSDLQRTSSQLIDFATLWQTKTGSKAVAITYAGRCDSAEKRRDRATWVRNFLTNRGSKGDVEVVEGGYRDKPEIELYIVDKGMPEPLASPTVHPNDVQSTKPCGSNSARAREPKE